jgi:hypothetical protein
MRATTVTHLRCWLFGACALAAVLLAGRMLPSLNRMREDYSLPGITGVSEVPIADTLLTQGTGPFRAFAIMTLWVRATKLQEQGLYFEQNDLFRLISRLQPRFASVWAHWAWNLSYNISVKFPPGFERWRWVQAGIRILRDRGIPNNRNSVLLYRELAWIYHHKIGQSADDSHAYYKVALAIDMQRALGRPPYPDTIRAMAEAPKTREELLTDPAVRDLVQRLGEAGPDPFEHPLEVVNRSLFIPEPARDILDDQANRGAVAKLEIFLRARYVEDVLKLELDRMNKYMVHFGTEEKPARIDWRLPSAHALYWAGYSVDIAKVNFTKAVNSDRVFLYALQDQYRNGGLRFHVPEGGGEVLWLPAPNFDFLEPCLQLHRDISKEYQGTRQTNPTYDNVLNFLREAVLDLYTYKSKEQAMKYYRILVKEGPESEDMLLEEFIWKRTQEVMRGLTHSHALKMVQGLHFSSLISLALGQNEAAVRQREYAEWVRRRYNTSRSRTPLPEEAELRKTAIRLAREILPDWAFQNIRETFPDAVKQLEKEEGADERIRDPDDFTPPPPPEPPSRKSAEKLSD